MAVEAVVGEPVSVRVSLLSGKIQGTFVDPASKTELGSIFAHVNHRVVAKFPTHRNREFFGANRESYPHIRDSRCLRCLKLGSGAVV